MRKLNGARARNILIMSHKIRANTASEAHESPLVETCPECNLVGLILDDKRGELICPSCGIVVEATSFDFSQEKRAFTAEEVENRHHNGAPISALSDISWTNVIRTREAAGNERLRRAVKWQTRLAWDKKNLLIAVTEIKRLCTNLGLPRIVAETAATLYKKVQKKNILRGRSISGFVGACVYGACRINQVPRSVVEIYEQMEHVTDRDIRICYRALVSELDLKIPKINPVQLLPRYATMLGVGPAVTVHAERMLGRVYPRLEVSGKDPKGFIAAALYLASKEMGVHKSQKAVSVICSITEVTLRSRIKEFEEIARHLS